ncbi:hypothetical protein [Clostridium prolinivorans]|uniref:hypothetical protein n=1 Tax=Clostridium prolinivorans TaxID=2769420 RepID=UPI000FDCA3CD|nr:hypothetical protein [Clostridium prolinivorans]
MLKLSLFEFIVRSIPEEFLFVLAVHAFSKTRINLKKYLLSGILFSFIVYLIRMLPIQLGIHTILNLVIIVTITSFINKIDIINSIRAGFIIFILGFIFEGINLLFIQFLLKKDLNYIMSNTILKTLYGLPSLFLFAIFVIAYYIILLKRNELN